MIEAWYLAQLVAMATCLLSPQRVIFGGGVLNLAGVLAALRVSTVELLNGYLVVPALGKHVDRYVVTPGLGHEAGVLGGKALATGVLG